jgi:hypothetical protein
MENAGRDRGDALKIPRICDREGDNYELFDKAIQSGRHFLIRIVHNRMTVENGQILDKIRETHCKGRIKAHIPRDSRGNLKEREVTLRVRYARYEIKKPQMKEQKQSAAAVITRDCHIRERGEPAQRY